MDFESLLKPVVAALSGLVKKLLTPSKKLPTFTQNNQERPKRLKGKKDHTDSGKTQQQKDDEERKIKRFKLYEHIHLREIYIRDEKKTLYCPWCFSDCELMEMKKGKSPLIGKATYECPRCKRQQFFHTL